MATENTVKDKETITADQVGNLNDVLNASGTDSKNEGTTDVAVTSEKPQAEGNSGEQEQSNEGDKGDEAVQSADPVAAAAAALVVQEGNAVLTQAAPVVEQKTAAAAKPVEVEKAVVAQVTSSTVTSTTKAADIGLDLGDLSKLTSQTQSALATIQKYASDMDPRKPQSDASIQLNQRILAASLHTVLAAEDKNFRLAYQALLKIVRANLSLAFSPTSRNRGLANMPHEAIDNAKMRFLTYIVDLLVKTAGSNDVEFLKRHTDMEKVLGAIKDRRIKENLTAYYST